MKRVFDCSCAVILLLLFALPMLLIALAIKVSSTGPMIHWSRRVGKDNKTFFMPKFRTMRTDAPQLATHLLPDSERWITPVGAWLRRTSLDELPQLWTVLQGEMSTVGPRPALFNQFNLVEQRSRCRVHQLLPGITGWAQIHGRDKLTIAEKVALDEYYLHHQTLWLDIRIILATAKKAIRGDDIVNGSEQAAPELDIRVAGHGSQPGKHRAA